MIRIKSTQANAVVCGQTLSTEAYYVLEPVELHRWQTDTAVWAAIEAGELIVNDGTGDLTPQDGVTYLKTRTLMDF